MVQEAVEDGGGQGGVVVEERGPLFEGFVGGQDDGAAFVAGADDLEEQVGALLVDGQVADFVEDQQAGRGIAFEFGFQAVSGLGGAEGANSL